MNTHNLTPHSSGVTSANHTIATETNKHRFPVFALVALFGIVMLASAGCDMFVDSDVRGTREAIIKYHNATRDYPESVVRIGDRYIAISAKNHRALLPVDQAILDMQDEIYTKQYAPPGAIRGAFTGQGTVLTSEERPAIYGSLTPAEQAILAQARRDIQFTIQQDSQRAGAGIERGFHQSEIFKRVLAEVKRSNGD